MAKAMILAAGQGTRVRPLTKNMPKPMVPILGKPVMEYIIEHLKRYGVTEIMVNVAFNHWKIENYFGDGHRWGVKIGYSYEGAREHGEIVPKPCGSAGGMKRIQDFSGFFDETTIVLCGDAIIDLDISAALFEHKSKKAMASVVTLEVPLDQVKNYGIVVSDKEGQITSFQEKPEPEKALSKLASTGINAQPAPTAARPISMARRRPRRGSRDATRKETMAMGRSLYASSTAASARVTPMDCTASRLMEPTLLSRAPNTM